MYSFNTEYFGEVQSSIVIACLSNSAPRLYGTDVGGLCVGVAALAAQFVTRSILLRSAWGIWTTATMLLALLG